MSTNRRTAGAAAAACAVALLATPPSIGSAASKNFVPDVVFTGSSLTGWRPIGDAKWRAENGEIVGTPGAPAGGWLIADRSYQDVALYTSFRCSAGCATGVLLRAERTADGGLKGIFTSLVAGDLAAYRVTLDANGKETSRERLRAAGGGQVRVAPPPPPPPPAGAPAAAPGAGRGGPGGGRGFQPLALPGGVESPIARPPTGLQENQWNDVELVLDANVLRPFLNDVGGIAGGVADEEFGRFGPVALFVGGTGEVRFKDVSFKDLQTRVAQPEQVSKRFRMQALNEFYYSWGPAVADINKDGSPDIVAGPYFYLGPDYNVAREIYMAQTIDASTRYFNGVQFAYDFTGDGWPDVINSLFTQPTMLYVNPKGDSRRWDAYQVTDAISSEIALLRDTDADGRLEYIVKDGNNQIVSATPDPAKPTAPWIKRPLTERGPWTNHGMGLGDVNKDGRLDLLNGYGWFEQPPAGTTTTWTYHPAAFGKQNRSSAGGAEMAVYDVNGDGLNDVVTSMQAHGWGLSWFEQKKAAGGAITFVEHRIMGDFSTKNAGNVTFSQPHGTAFADIDGDGTPDFITGKRFWSHLDTWIDPDPHGPPVLYVYRTVRNAKAPGGAEFVPELVHNRSGMGSLAAVADLNKDGAVEIITSTKRGTFIFWNQWKSAR
jgi:hypothetical protein